VPDPDDFSRAWHYAIDDDIGTDREFTGSRVSTLPPSVWKKIEPITGREEPHGDARGGVRVVLGDISSDFSQVVYRLWR
jgi:hypothetical protein